MITALAQPDRALPLGMREGRGFESRRRYSSGNHLCMLDVMLDTHNDRLPPTTVQEYMLRTLAAFAPDNNAALCWRLDNEYAPIIFFADVSDVFRWGTSDMEDIRSEDVPLLEQAYADVVRVGGDVGWVGDLYAARKRGLRPQGAMYSMIPTSLWPLFDAAGPTRPEGFVNPDAHHEAEDPTALNATKGNRR